MNSAHLHTNNTQNNTMKHKTTQRAVHIYTQNTEQHNETQNNAMNSTHLHTNNTQNNTMKHKTTQ